MPLKLLLIPVGAWVATKVVAATVVMAVPKYRKKAIHHVKNIRNKASRKKAKKKEE